MNFGRSDDGGHAMFNKAIVLLSLVLLCAGGFAAHSAMAIQRTAYPLPTPALAQAALH